MLGNCGIHVLDLWLLDKLPMRHGNLSIIDFALSSSIILLLIINNCS